jgi:xylulokinase
LLANWLVESKQVNFNLVMTILILAVDIGSTWLKAAMVDEAGHVLIEHRAPSPLAANPACPNALLRLVGHAVALLCEKFKPHGIAITAATRTSVLVQANGEAIGEILKIDDAFSDQYADALQVAYSAETSHAFGSFHPIARLMHIRDIAHERYVRAKHFMEIKDWINMRLTDTACTDSVSHSRIDPSQGSMASVLGKLGMPDSLIAPSQQPGMVVGLVKNQLEGWPDLRGVYVAQCGFDTWCATYGMGCVKEEAVYNVSGTTDVFGAFTMHETHLSGVPCLPWDQLLHHSGGPCSTGLGTLAWFGSKFLNNSDPQAVLQCAAMSSDDYPLCLPFVNGERMPFWRSDLQASFTCVKSSHGMAEFARAIVDGLLAFQKWLLKILRPSPAMLFLGGGGANLQGWAQLKASAFGQAVYMPQSAEPGLLGAVMTALVAGGHFESMQAAQAMLAKNPLLVRPEPHASDRLGKLELRLRQHLPNMENA